MLKIPYVIQPQENELLYSWLCRLSNVNCFDNVNDFANSYIFTNPNDKKILRYDVKDIGLLIHTLPSFFDIKRIFSETSLYPLTSLFMTASEQTSMINSIFRPRKYNTILVQNKDSIFKELHFCPECKKEELDNLGFYYYHRDHQIPGVKICAKHGCILHRLTDHSYNKIFDANNRSKPLNLASSYENEYKYSSFAKSLLLANFDLNITDIKDIIFNQINKLNLSYEEYENRIIQRDLHKLMHTQSIRKFLCVKLIPKRNISIQDAITVLMDLFDDVSNIPLLVPTVDYALVSQMNDENYFITSYRNDFLVLNHLDCNNEFITTINGYRQGWRCPHCERLANPNSIVKRLINNTGNKQYELLSDFNGWDTSVRLLHKRCNKIIEIKPREFIFEDKRCRCESVYSFEEIKNTVESLGDFDLLESYGTKKIVIRHKTCGEVFESDYYKFVKYPWCKRCYIPKIKTKEQFENETKKITTDDYKLIGKFHASKTEKIKLLHCQCGSVSEMYAWRFLNGQRCPRCTDELKLKDFKTFVSKISNGQYECHDKEIKNNMVHIIDTKTNEIKSMNKSLVIQELTRPTPSRKLPLSVRNDQVSLPLSQASHLYNILKRIYKFDDYIFLEDLNIKIPQMDYLDFKRLVQTLRNQNKLTLVYPGIYTFPGHQSSDCEVITNRYINRNGQIIGYLYGDSFFYANGFNIEKPKCLMITTLKEPSTHGRQTKMFNQTLKIKRPKYEDLNERNILILPILDRLAQNQLLNINELEFVNSYLTEHNISDDELKKYSVYYSNLVKKRINEIISQKQLSKG